MNLANQARNERLKTDRRIRALQKMAKGKNFSDAERAKFKAEIKQLRQASNATRQYTKSGRKIKSRTAEQRQAAVDALKSLNERYDVFVRSRAVGARNVYIKQQMRLAKSGRESIYTKKEMNIFFSSTKQAWQGVEADKRTEAIAAYYGTNDYERLIRGVLNAYMGKAYEIMGEQFDFDEEMLDEYMDAMEESDRYNYYGQVSIGDYINAI